MPGMKVWLIILSKENRKKGLRESGYRLHWDICSIEKENNEVGTREGKETRVSFFSCCCCYSSLGEK